MSSKKKDYEKFRLDDDLIERSMKDIKENSELYDSFAGESGEKRGQE